MNQVIIYKQDNGVVAIINPVQEAVEQYGIEAIALKDVPVGKPFKIISRSDLPTDRSLRNAWTVEESDLTDGVGAAWSTFDEVSA